MFGAYSLQNNAPLVLAPPSFKANARLAIYQQLQPTIISSACSVTSYDSSPSVQSASAHVSRRALSSLFSKHRSIPLVISLCSNSTATIPEYLEQVSVTVEQLVSDVALHEQHYHKEVLERRRVSPSFPQDEQELYKISLGSDVEYQAGTESLVDWNLNVTRCRLMLIHLPMVSSLPLTHYSQHDLPQLVGDLSKHCHIVLIQPHITDTELIHAFSSCKIYSEHHLDPGFKKSVAEISVKQSRLLQINQVNLTLTAPMLAQSCLKVKFKCIAIRNYLVNLAAAATTAHEYKEQLQAYKGEMGDESFSRISKAEKNVLWNNVRRQVFMRAGLE